MSKATLFASYKHQTKRLPFVQSTARRQNVGRYVNMGSNGRFEKLYAIGRSEKFG